MTAVFVSFVTSTVVVIEQLAVGLAASILIDATVFRLLLVPWVMYLIGRSAWWLPRAGIGATDLDALEHLEADCPLTQRDLGERLSLTSGAVTMLVDRLERAG